MITTPNRYLGPALEKNSLRPMLAGEYSAILPLRLFVRILGLQARDAKGRELYLYGIWREVPARGEAVPPGTPLGKRICLAVKEEARHLPAWLQAQRYILAQHLRWHPRAGNVLRLLYPTRSWSHTPATGWQGCARKSKQGQSSTSAKPSSPAPEENPK